MFEYVHLDRFFSEIKNSLIHLILCQNWRR